VPWMTSLLFWWCRVLVAMCRWCGVLVAMCRRNFSDNTYICCIPRLIVSFSYANPCGLWIVNPQPSLNGSCIIFSSSICVTQKRVLEPMHHKKEHKNSTQCWNQCIINKNISSQCWNQSIIRRNIITQWWNQCTIRRNISPWCWN